MTLEQIVAIIISLLEDQEGAEIKYRIEREETEEKTA